MPHDPKLTETLAARGFLLFPTIANEKRPTGPRDPDGPGWQETATSDIPTLRKMLAAEPGCGVGIKTGDGLMVVDADTKGGTPGVQSLDLIEMMGADIGFLVETPSGGRHAYFTVPKDTYIPGRSKKLEGYPGIDIRGDGGLVVAPGSTIDGKPYRIIRDGDPLPAPQWLIDLAVDGRKRRDRSDGAPVAELDSEPNIQRAIDYLVNHAPEAIEGAGGNETTYRVLARVKDFGVSKDTAVDLAIHHWNETKASPPWDAEELEKLADNAYSYGTSPPGVRSALAEFDVVEVIDRRTALGNADPVVFATPADFEHGSPPRREWIVEGVIPKGHVTLLYGDGGLGKTLLAQQLATSIALNTEWAGRKVTPGKVLCVFSEDDTDEIWRRQVDINRSANTSMQAINGGIYWWTADHVAESGCVLMNFTAQHPSGQVTPFFRRLDAAVALIKPALVIVDPIANMFGGSELDRAQVTGFVNRTLKRLCVAHKTTVLALAHPSVAGMASGSGLSGSTGWNNAVRSRLYLKSPKSDPSGDYRELEGVKSNYGRRGRIALLKWTQGAFVVATGSDGDPAMRVDRALWSALRVLVERGEILSASNRAQNYAVRRAMHLPETSGLKRSELEEAFERLQRAGVVRTETTKDKFRRPIPLLCVDDIPVEQQAPTASDDF